MDKVLWARIWSPLLERWPSARGGANLFLSLYREKAKWSRGWSVANVSKRSCPRSTINSPRHYQTSKGTNTNNFSLNQNHPTRLQTPLTKFEKIQILADFEIGQMTLTLPRLNWQLPPQPLGLIFSSLYMDILFWAKRWVNIMERWPSTSWGPNLFLSLYREKAKGGLGWSVANVSKGSCPRST